MPHAKYLVATTTTALLLLLVQSSAPGAIATSTSPPVPSVASLRTGTLGAAGLRRLERARWQSVRTTGGEPTINVSPAYSDPAAVTQRWSSFFHSLIHGSELGLLNAYIAPLPEVREICGNSDVLGCYGANHLVAPDQGAEGIAATSIATHEYGHHIAFNRVNPPWIAVDWGTKRWGTYERVCPRVLAGTAFPGAEDANYPLNPGEAFAESYRVLNETGAGLPMTWPIVDPSFMPDAQALAALREDVIHPWVGPTTTTIPGKFLRRGRTWTTTVATPLDGDLRIRATVPGGGADDMTLVSSDGGRVLATSSWDGSGGKSVEYRVCGARSVKVRVSRGGAAARFSLRVTAP